eukprot:3685540-Heterocapsa_arctica.AAC.1
MGTHWSIGSLLAESVQSMCVISPFILKKPPPKCRGKLNRSPAFGWDVKSPCKESSNAPGLPHVGWIPMRYPMG